MRYGNTFIVKKEYKIEAYCKVLHTKRYKVALGGPL